jgi:hypothetical protein
MDPVIVNHVFLTARFLIKGRVLTGEQRLTSFLRSYRRAFLSIEDITMFDLERSDQIVAARGQLRVEDILLAHEFLDVAGDMHSRALVERESQAYRMASIYFRAPTTFEVVGRVREEFLGGALQETFFVVQEPNLRGLQERTERDFLQLKRMPYTIVNGGQVHCIFNYE